MPEQPPEQPIVIENNPSLAGAIVSAEIRLPSADINEDLNFFTRKLGFRLDQIFPADDPSTMLLSGYGLTLRLEKGVAESPGTLRLMCREPAVEDGFTVLRAPNGTRIELVYANTSVQTPATQHAFVVRRLKDKAPWVIGRAGMHYRDLIPDRLGGSIIASHIRIPDGGPVPDMVHYHTVGFQLIYCYKGWVDVVYEDQGPPIRLAPGDCVTQPPEIRHRVLESSENLEVIEIGVPAEHVTTIDHEMTLPTDNVRPERVFGGQTFVHHKVSDANWSPWRMSGFECRDTGISTATGGVANVQVARTRSASSVDSSQPVSHNSDILFTFVLEGSMTLQGQNGSHALNAGDAFVVPPCEVTHYTNCSPALELLEVSLPGEFDTSLHDAFATGS